ncbi:MAG: hypothetical protein JKY65_17540, partial [Planctomycetes bacterium]|nr:hypothetical protein [Planctomycetota bacterium]
MARRLGPSRLAASLSLLVLGLGLSTARAETRVEAKIVSRRGQSVHLELTSPVPAGSARLVPGREVEVKPAQGESFRTKLVAVSSRFLVIE